MTSPSGSPPGWRITCPSCRSELGDYADLSRADVARGRSCPGCGQQLEWRAGMLDARPKRLRVEIDSFLEEYGAVRRAEGRGSDDPGWYRALPFVPRDDPLAWQWDIRAKSWRCLEERLVRRRPVGRGLDLGAGVGWLSARLSAAGWDMLAIDLSEDSKDGLGAARHYAESTTPPDRPPFHCMLAHFDHLPLTDSQADLIVFNASFHYSPDYPATLREALRVLAPDGRIVALDSPSYRRADSGELMVRARRADFQNRFGFRSDALGSREFLVEGELEVIGRELGLHWRRIRPRYGMKWRLRPLRYRLARAGREPARFGLWVGRREPGRML